MPRMVIAPSILAGDFSKFARELKRVEKTGTEWVHLDVMDGHFVPNLTFGPQAIADARRQLTAAGVRPQLLVDCSHGNSNKDHAQESVAFRDVVEQRAAGNADIIGCMVESHLFPGRQALGDDPSKLAYGVSITDACIGWDETEELLTWIHKNVG